MPYLLPRTHRTTPRPSRAGLVTLLMLPLLLSGCNFIAWGAAASRPDDEATVEVAAEYLDLVDKRVAVMVSADEYTLFRFPRATDNVGQSVGNAIHANVENAVVSIPREVARYQRKNPYWITSRPSRLIADLGVDRLVVIDLNEYRTNEEGNSSVWRGVIDGTVTVYEADGEDPDNATFQRPVRAEYPEGGTFGLVSADADQHKIEAAALQRFTLRAAGLFYDHEDVPR
ncbi:hypothetical protein [Algisphaera agarilytica]|uniref:Uncharacterized protein n=1 Tax=Algisphaera agarilytica TaxID=1385975 RepID=A0A7X0H6I3_9BACT|nr:hypothetical protein [Algisphaera agarilytica]MBB6428694.1 hypothetical protein [Algisphaera agarilytica]